MRLSLGIVALVVCLFPSVLAARPNEPKAADGFRLSGGTSARVSTSTLLLHRESAGPDTFDLYGGPRRLVRDPDGIPGSGDEYVEGKFEDASASVPRGLSTAAGDWTGVDLTEIDIHSRIHDFNCENLNDNGPGNLALWVGVPAGHAQAAGWATAPGYGNSWREELLFETPVTDPAVGQTVGLDFFFNLDTERGYDFLSVEFDSAGTWSTVYEESGSNRVPATGVFEPPGLQFSQEPAQRPIVFAGNDYGEDDQIRIRIRFRSDAAFSDEDGFHPSQGAFQLDDVVITTADGIHTEDYQDGVDDVFTAVRQPFFGDFSDVYPDFQDIDPCRENETPMVGFIDYGQDVRNGPGVDGTVSTGGDTHPSWDYGLPGGFVVNWHHGLDPRGDLLITNEVWSPPIAWDLEGTADDAAEFVGARLDFSVFRHQPLIDAKFYVWHVRSEIDGEWGPWQDRNFVYYSQDPEWRRYGFDVTDLVATGVERIQIALGIVDLTGLFGFHEGATPGPLFDDVRFVKYRVGGPVLRVEPDWLPQDAFPASGGIDVTTPTDRDALDVRFDMGRDVAGDTATAIVSGDSIVVDVATVIDGTSVVDVTLHWRLRQNPAFEADLRTVPTGPSFGPVDVRLEEDRVVWEGTADVDTVRTAFGTTVDGRFFAALPDEDFLYPGDVLHFYWKAEDSDGRVSTLPHDLSGYGDWTAAPWAAYDRDFTMRALPSVREFTVHTTKSTISDPTGPGLLVVDEGQDRAERDAALDALARAGYVEHVDFDVYTVRDAADAVGNGLGAYAGPTPLGDRRGPGARPEQLQHYGAILFLGDTRGHHLIADEVDDKSRDLEVLQGFKGLSGPRTFLLFGDRVVSALGVRSTEFVQNELSVERLSNDVLDRLGSTTDLNVEGLGVPDGLRLTICPRPGWIDAVRPLGVAQAAWQYIHPVNGTPVTDFAAGVVHDRDVSGARRLDVTLPFALSRVQGRVALIEALVDIGDFMVPLPTDAPAAPRAASLSIAPNPFNPTTTVDFALPRTGVEASVVVYDLRGKQVRRLFDGTAASADLRLVWDGRDDGGSRVASGIYLVGARTEGFRGTRKVALIK